MKAEQNSIPETEFRTPQSPKNRTLKPHFAGKPLFVLGKITDVLKSKNPRKPRLSRVSDVYPGRESNPHSLNGNRILSPACLPVPPPGQD